MNGKIKTLAFLSILGLLVMNQFMVQAGTSPTAPSINGMENVEYEVSEGEIYTISWNITDDNPRDYEITLNGDLFSSGNWEEPNDLNPVATTHQVSVDLLVDPSEYTLTIEVSDYDDLHASFSTVVNAKAPATPDSILGPNLIEFFLLFGSGIAFVLLRDKTKLK